MDRAWPEQLGEDFSAVSNWTQKLLEGMDTQEGVFLGGLSLGSLFFPFFNSFLHIFPPPIGWSPKAAGVLVTAACLFIKLAMHKTAAQAELRCGGRCRFCDFSFLALSTAIAGRCEHR